MHLILRRDYDAATLVREHPPRLSHAHKQLVYELCGGAHTTGSIAVTRWDAEPIPTELSFSRSASGLADGAATRVEVVPGYYDYAGEQRAVWHVNFADPVLFVAYGSALLAQDELQAAEHPALGSIREALVAEDALALTEQDGVATPVLVAGVERRCTIDTAPCDARPYGMYGNRFAMTPLDDVRGAIRVHRPPARSNLIAIAAPTGWGEYTRPQLEQIVVTAYTGFAAAVAESQRMWPGEPVEVRTGFWGCGAFGGNRHVMSMLQIFAARLAGIARLRFYVFDDAGRDSFAAGAAALERVLSGARDVADVIERIADLDYVWGVSDGN